MTQSGGDTVNSSSWPSRPRTGNISVTAILDDAFNLLRYHFALVLTTGALFIVPLTLLSSFLTDRVAPNVQAHTQHFVDLSNQIQAHGTVSDKAWNSALAVVAKDYVKIFAVSGCTALLQACLVGCALAIAVCMLYLDRQTTVGACYRLAASRFVKAIAAMLAAGALVLLCVGVPALLGLLTGSSDLTTALVFFATIAVIVLGVRLSLVVQVVAVEGRGLSALARSIALTRGYFWKVISLTLLTSFVVLLMINLTGAIVMRATNSEVVDVLANVIITTIMTPLVLCAQTLLYLQLRLAKEDFSPQALAGEVERV
jgi:hypothetical protein